MKNLKHWTSLDLSLTKDLHKTIGNSVTKRKFGCPLIKSQ